MNFRRTSSFKSSPSDFRNLNLIRFFRTNAAIWKYPRFQQISFSTAIKSSLFLQFTSFISFLPVTLHFSDIQSAHIHFTTSWKRPKQTLVLTLPCMCLETKQRKYARAWKLRLHYCLFVKSVFDNGPFQLYCCM